MNRLLRISPLVRENLSVAIKSIRSNGLRSLLTILIIAVGITSLVGIFAVSASLEGYMFHDMKWYERVLSAIGGLLLIYPGTVTDIIGIALVVLVVIFEVLTKKKNA